MSATDRGAHQFTAKPKNSVTVFVDPFRTIVLRLGTPIAAPEMCSQMDVASWCQLH